jgi:protein-S-isoprenylcysteine O-methyltransferase Ste14
VRYRYLFDGLWLILAVYWVAAAWGNKATAHRANPTWRAMLLVFIILLFWLFIEYPATFSRRMFPPTLELIWAGLALCAAGIGFAIWARHTLGRNWSGNPTIKEGHELIEAGPYRVVRHPIYTGFLAAILGTYIGGGRVRELIVLVLSFVILWFKLRVEEGLMTRQFPEAYPAYKARTKALIPFVL